MDSDKLKKDFKKWSFEMKMRNIFFKNSVELLVILHNCSMGL